MPRTHNKAKNAKGRRATSRRPNGAPLRNPADAWRRSPTRKLIGYVLAVVALWAMLAPVLAQSVGPQDNMPAPLTEAQAELLGENTNDGAVETPYGPSLTDTLNAGPEQWTSPGGLVSTLKIMLVLTVLSLAPAIMIMTTSFIRIIVVLGLLRQAIGTQQLPPSQVITTLALFITLLIMTPVWTEVYNEAIVPYEQGSISFDEAWARGERPVRLFMSMQIENTGNTEDVYLFMSYIPDAPPLDETSGYDDVPWRALLPAFMLSELKTAFLIGFQIYLPFLILDMVIASVMVSMGMLMLPPVLISLPFKLMLFVLLDGWHLIVGMLMESFAMYGT